MSDRYLEGRYSQQLKNIRHVVEMTLRGYPEEEREENGAVDYESAIILINNMLLDTERATEKVEELGE